MDREATLANVLRRVGQYDRSRELCLEVLHDAVERGDERERTSMLGLLADVETDAGNLLLAREYAAEFVELGEQQDERTIRMYGLLGGATVCALLGELDEAETLARAGQELALSPVLDPWLAWGDHALGLVALDRGEPAAALEHFEDSERRNDAAGFIDPVCRQPPNGIEALIALGRLDDAAARIAEYEAAMLDRAPRAAFWRWSPASAGSSPRSVASTRTRKRSSRGRSSCRSGRRARTSARAR